MRAMNSGILPLFFSKTELVPVSPLHSDEGLTSETSVSDTPDFHDVQLSL